AVSPPKTPRPGRLVKASGVCGTDLHIHDGEFGARFPLIPGHETVGVVAAFGRDVQGFTIGDRVVADNSELCGHCHYCHRGKELFCDNFIAHGVMVDGVFAEYAAYPAHHVFTFKNLCDLDATLLEPAAYGVYKDDDRVSLSPNTMFKEEINVLGSFSQTHKFPTAIDYLGKCPTISTIAYRKRVKVDGIVNKTFKLEEWQACLDAMKNKSVIKAAIVFD
ncbi:hypothetical protein N7537_007548, partial [Penicillium hordei]